MRKACCTVKVRLVGTIVHTEETRMAALLYVVCGGLDRKRRGGI